jgi:hypothetical protein
MASEQLSHEKGRNIIADVNGIIGDPSTICGTPGGIGTYNVIIACRNSDGSMSYTIAKHIVGGVYPLTDEWDIHPEQTPDGVRWVMEGTQSFHNPRDTKYPHIFVDGIHVILVRLS